MVIDLWLTLDALIAGSAGDTRSSAWAALTIHVVLASGRELTDRPAAERRLLVLRRELQEALVEEAGPPETRMLIVEDCDAIADAIPPLLGRSFKTVRAVDGLAARELLSTGEPFDVVLSDVEMPRLDGVGLLRWIRAERAELVARVVFMTVDPGLPAARFISFTHVHPVLQKPFTQAMLLDALRGALKGEGTG